MVFLAGALPGLAALIALLFTWVSVGQTAQELRIAEQGQLTDRFSVAVQNLGARPMDVRLGGIYALQRIMQDSSRDHATVVAVLSAFVREHSRDGPNATRDGPPPTDIAAALGVLAARPHDGAQDAVVDLRQANLRGLSMVTPNLEGANFAGADLSGALLKSPRLREADFSGAKLVGATITERERTELHDFPPRADLSGANFRHADLTDADLSFAEMPGAVFHGANLTGAQFNGAQLNDAGLGEGVSFGTPPPPANLTGASLNGANLRGANLVRANLTAVDLGTADLRNAEVRKANLTGAHLGGADLRKANLKGADLTGADLSGADLRDADLTGSNFTGADLTGVQRAGAKGLPPPGPAGGS
ncbi:pentapeptide repeat-containing protein [Streptomyces gardneri]|uniref:pentapeptide repeat-containing protein n=1 Tax=Streptomyces gardneri TaxID=66892 RepID=UPI00367BEAC2